MTEIDLGRHQEPLIVLENFGEGRVAIGGSLKINNKAA
jgi:hypothetical protein